MRFCASFFVFNARIIAMDSKVTSVLVIERHKLVSECLSSVINGKEEFQVVGQLKNAGLAMAFLKHTKVDLILMNVKAVAEGTVIRYIPEIRQTYPEIKIIVMTDLPEVTFSRRINEAGANAFIHEDMTMEDLRVVISRVLDGEKIFLSNYSSKAQIYASLNETEETILRLFCQGYERREIADRIYLSENTIKFHIRKMLAKTGYTSVLRLAVDAISQGYIVLEEDKEKR